jgi:hypothetical protein
MVRRWSGFKVIVRDNQGATVVKQPLDRCGSEDFKAMRTYGQFAWYEPLRMTAVVMKMKKVVVDE